MARMRTTEAHPRSWLANASRSELERRILGDAERVRERDERVRELIRERDAARLETEAALDLVEQYARKAGVDTSRDETLKYVGQYWSQRGEFERQWTLLEGQRWDAQRFALDLRERGRARSLDHLSGSEVALRVGERVSELWSAQDLARRSVDIFGRPAA